MVPPLCRRPENLDRRPGLQLLLRLGVKARSDSRRTVTKKPIMYTSSGTKTSTCLFWDETWTSTFGFQGLQWTMYPSYKEQNACCVSWIDLLKVSPRPETSVDLQGFVVSCRFYLKKNYESVLDLVGVYEFDTFIIFTWTVLWNMDESLLTLIWVHTVLVSLKYIMNRD